MLAYDVFAEHVAIQYKSFEESINGIYWLAITRHKDALVGLNAFDYKARMSFASESFKAAVNNMAELHANQLASGGEDALNSLRYDIDSLAVRLTGITESVINAATQAIKRENLKKAISQKPTGVFAKLELLAHDKIGRNYQANYFTHLAARQFSINAHITVLKASGAERIALRNEANEIVDVLTVADGENGLEELRMKYFHPNTRLKAEIHVAT